MHRRPIDGGRLSGALLRCGSIELTPLTAGCHARHPYLDACALRPRMYERRLGRCPIDDAHLGKPSAGMGCPMPKPGAPH